MTEVFLIGAATLTPANRNLCATFSRCMLPPEWPIVGPRRERARVTMTDSTLSDHKCPNREASAMWNEEQMMPHRTHAGSFL